MEGLLSELDKLNVKTEDELFAEQFSKLSAGNNNINKMTENHPFSYTTHKMFGKEISHPTTSENIKDISYFTIPKSINTTTAANEINDNNDDAIGWYQPPKANEEEEGWGNLPDVNTSVDSNRKFGMNSILGAENLNLSKANDN
ncbi:hypothetical protein GLOIN_2v1497183 [Rhizophagus clarus]|uniref:Uncharacterized protein n=1 Tax=Rhizophagus clarus TaxID=94130 RepID=A0A8H3KQG9_9GLOM|nr:hypothetical protein GLOIN_2v1497183 [Rhizophagus clarus]